MTTQRTSPPAIRHRYRLACAPMLMGGAVAIVVLSASAARAVQRTCSTDPLANTTAVLCAPPSGPCTQARVTVSSDLEFQTSSCDFDLGGRELWISKTLQVSGSRYLAFWNTGAVTITASGKLKARGDYLQPAGVIVPGGNITIQAVSTSTSTITHLGRIDVSGDPAGAIRLEAMSDLTLQGGSSILGNGDSATSDDGDRFADGGTLDLISDAGQIAVSGMLTLRGQNHGSGGTVRAQAARNVRIDQAIDASGGGGGGGDVELTAGDSIAIDKEVNVDSRGGGGAGGSITLDAGRDDIGGVLPGGALTIAGSSLALDGSGPDGDGGSLDGRSRGALAIDSASAIHISGGLDASSDGGTIVLDSNDDDRTTIGPLDGDIRIDGLIVARSGGQGGKGGRYEVNAARHLTQTASIDLSGQDAGGSAQLAAGGNCYVSGAITAQGTTAPSAPGDVDLTAGITQMGTLTVAANIAANGGSGDATHETISLQGCGVAVGNGVMINGGGGVGADGKPGGSNIRLTALSSVSLHANARLTATPGGEVTITHPPGVEPSIDPSTQFTPAFVDVPNATAAYPRCGGVS